MDIEKYKKAESIINGISIREREIDEFIQLKSNILSSIDNDLRVCVNGKNYSLIESEFIKLIDSHIKIYTDQVIHLIHKFDEL